MIKDILMRRDGLTEDEAENMINECRERIDEIIYNGGNLDDVERCMADLLGLEPDYIFELLGWL